MSRSDHGGFTPSSSSPASKAHSMNQDLLHQPSDTATLNVLFLGETNIGGGSILDLITGPGQEKGPPGHRDGARSIALDGRVFTLHGLPANGSMSPVALQERIQKTLTDIHKNGGVHLLVYCMSASDSTDWIHGTHKTIVSYSTPSSHIPAVAVVAGDEVEQERWWLSNKDAFAERGLCFDDHAFIPMMNKGAQSPSGDHITEGRHVLHTLIQQNCAYALSSETNSNSQRATPYKQQLMGNSLHSLLPTLVVKPTRISPNPPALDVVLLGEVGVGKSSLINLIARENVAEVSSDIIGCTKAPVKHTFEEKDRTFHLYDTPGLVDPQMGVDPFIDPIDAIEKLIRGLGDGKGPDLLLFCIDNSKPTAALQRNYRLFSKVICRGRVPFALAITKLDEGQDANEWQSRYGAMIRGFSINCSGYFGLGRERGHAGSNADPAGQLRRSFLEFIIECTDRQRNKISLLRASMGRAIVSVTSSLRVQAWTPERALMKQCGLERQTARELASRMSFSKES